MTTVFAPGTLENDPKRQNQALQDHAAKISSNTTSIATNTAAISALTAVVATKGPGTVTSVATAGLATGGPITSTGTVTVTAAVQSDMETGTSTTVAVVPGVQKNHPLHPKAWAYVTQSAGSYTLVAASGVSAINKAATGRIDITLSPAFSSTSFAAIGMPGEGGPFICSEITANRTASNFRILCRNANTNTDADFGFSIMFFGDQ